MNLLFHFFFKERKRNKYEAVAFGCMFGDVSVILVICLLVLVAA
jgi:hypothetical protein